MKKLFLKIELFFAGLFGKSFRFLKENSHLAVAITAKLKNAVESPIADLITTLIPGNLDNEIITKLRRIVPAVATEIAIAHGIISEAKNNTAMYAAVIGHVKSMVPDARAGFWLEFSGRLNEALSDGQLTLAEAVILAQMAYREQKQEVPV